MKSSTRQPKTTRSASNEAANSLAKLIAPLLNARCISIRQFTAALRSAAVEFEASKYPGPRLNKARIAFSLGLTRGEVAKQLLPGTTAVKNNIESVLSTWCDDFRFQTAERQPADLPIFGKTGSFEQIAKIHGKGLPVRAMLDELLYRGLVSRLPGQKIRLRKRFAALEQSNWTEIENQLSVLSTQNKSTALDAKQPCDLPDLRTNLKRRPSRA